MKLFLIALSLIASHVVADVYMHNPPGGNNRNRERNDNRNNGDRLFDSQNNGKGGYAWRGEGHLNNGLPDPITYYSGSVLRIEWTNQHGAGDNPNVHGHIIIQYACDVPNFPSSGGEPIRDPQVCGQGVNYDFQNGNPCLVGLRDGYPTGQVVARDTGSGPGYSRARFAAENQGGVRNQNRDGTNDIPNPSQLDLSDAQQNAFYYVGDHSLFGKEFGLHESHIHYQRCKWTSRNYGLYNADQKLNNNAGARATRQNPNGARRGLECPEERDYYPYWNGLLNPWTDVAVLVDDASKCPYFQANSANVKAYGFCEGLDPADRFQNNYGTNQQVPISPEACADKGGTWNAGMANGGGTPVCQVAMTSRDNHLGNAVMITGGSDGSDDPGDVAPDFRQPETAHYLWTIPEVGVKSQCIVRIRYNMSTSDYANQDYALDGGNRGVGADSSLNCPRVTTSDGANVDDLQQAVDQNVQCTDLITGDSVPLFNRPYVNVFRNDPTVGLNQRLSIALNTHQSGRTFQDRSYVFNVAPSPLANGIKIINLNCRGRRGNIVQAYPAVEYDFVPTLLTVQQFDVVHIQFHGSEFNNAKNANNAEGWQYSDRCNMVEMPRSGKNFPQFVDKMRLMSPATAKTWALVGQDPQFCDVFENGDNNEQNDINNCGKLNQMAARYPLSPNDGLLTVANEAGTYAYVSTRNNNFSNRSQKGQMIVGGSNLSAAEVAGIVVGSLVGAAIVVGAVCCYGFRRPQTVAGQWFGYTASKCPCCISFCGKFGGSTGASHSGGHTAPKRLATSPKTVAPPDMEYTRH